MNHPHPSAKIHQIDIDPLKEQMSLWQIATTCAIWGDAATALRQLNEAALADETVINERRRHYSARHESRCKELEAREASQPNVITPEFLTPSIRRSCDSETIILNEGIKNYTTVNNHIGINYPRGRFTSGGSSLGWNGGAAIGMKLAQREKTIVCLTGDGSYMFSQPPPLTGWRAATRHRSCRSSITTADGERPIFRPGAASAGLRRQSRGHWRQLRSCAVLDIALTHL